MKLYGSFLIRCWIYSGDDDTQRLVFDVEHIQGGERLRFNNYDEAWQWMMQLLQSGDAASHPPAMHENRNTEKPISNNHS